MSTELALKDDLGVAKLGEIFVKSGFFRDTRDQAQAVVKILYGRELGFSPVVSMMGIHVIEGKPSLSSNLLGTLIKRSGRYDYRVIESTDKRCEIEFFEKAARKKESLGRALFTLEDAQRAGVVRPGGGWTKYPKAMLFARALSAGVKQHCPDVSACPLYVPEELGATVNEEGDVTELPKSAQPIERTTEPIPIRRESGSSAASPPEAAVSIADTASTREPGDDSADELIDLPRQRALHRAFKEAIQNEAAQKGAEHILRDWLKHEGYVDAEGKGTTKTIPMYLFEEVKTKAVAFAENLPNI